MTNKLTAKVVAELIAHEAIVEECYKDSKGIWTWSVGVTNASGHRIHPDYLDKPQSTRICLEIFIQLLRDKYVPAVEAAFAGHPLTEAQFAGALSFHYNTGAIKTADWVRKWKAGDIAGAKNDIMNWRKPPEIIPRREKERDLFFDGKWSQDGKATVYPVRKPSYSPNFSAGKRVDVNTDLVALLP
jgi:lysozyme